MAGEDDDKGATAAPVAMPYARLPLFSGEEDRHTSFEIWRFEVESLVAEKKSSAEIVTAIRRSLQGRASQTLRTLGVGATLVQILDKFKAVYGSTLSAQTVLSNFYQLKQREGEGAGAFAQRLENTLTQAVELGKVKTKHTHSSYRLSKSE